MKKDKILDIICLQCQHLDTQRIGGCKAFPGEIPDLILSGQCNHSTILKGQEGEYVYTPVEEPVNIFKMIERAAQSGKKEKSHMF